MHSNSQLTDCFASLALRTCGTGVRHPRWSSGADLRLYWLQLDIPPANPGRGIWKVSFDGPIQVWAACLLNIRRRSSKVGL